MEISFMNTHYVIAQIKDRKAFNYISGIVMGASFGTTDVIGNALKFNSSDSAVKTIDVMNGLGQHSMYGFGFMVLKVTVNVTST